MNCIYCNNLLSPRGKGVYYDCLHCDNVAFYAENNDIMYIEFTFRPYILEIGIKENDIMIYDNNHDILNILYIPQNINPNNAKSYLDRFLKLVVFK